MTSQKRAGYSHHFIRCTVVLVVTFFFILKGTANSADLTLAWDANSEPDLTGYLVFCGESSGNYSITKEVTSDNPGETPPTTCEFTGLEEGATYYFAAVAFSDSGQSDNSREISYIVPAAPVDPDGDGDGFTEAQGDCDDKDSSIYLGAPDKCGDGIDQNCNGVDLACPDNNSLIREAQYGELEGNFKNVYDSAAASGQYVYVPEGVGNLMDGPDENQKVTFTFNTPERGTYRIKGTVYASNGSSDSFWVKVNGSPAGGYLWDVLQNTSYQEDYVNNRNGADPVEVSLKSGVNTVAVYLREDGTRLERIELEPIAADPQETDDDGDGVNEIQGDCNDADPAINPNAADICGDGVDQNCDGADIDCKDIDDDRDGHTGNQGDCDDTNPEVFPGATETCGDGIDQDCSGSDLACVDYTTDSDNDGLTDYEEENIYLTNPMEADSDGDGVPDGEEVAGEFDPNYAEPKPETSTLELPLEFGEVEVDHNWKTVTLNRLFKDPVVIASALSYAGSDPAVIRVINVKRDSFEVRVQEWDYLNEKHATERVSYIVVESGMHDLANGAHLEAGSFTASSVSSFASTEFQRAFKTVPVVLTTINSFDEYDAVAMRLKNITHTGFEYRVQEQEANDRQHVPETAGYIAWEPSAGSMDGFMFEIGRTSNSFKHLFQPVHFDVEFKSPPVFLAGMQTTDGSDTAAVRWQNRVAEGIEVKVEEEQSRDTETNHTTEVIGYMVFEAGKPAPDDTQSTDELVREAEDFDQQADGGFETGYDTAASGAEYVYFPNGIGTRFSGPDEGQKIVYTFYVAKEGTYRIKGAVHAANGSDDSFWIKFTDENQTGLYLWDVLQNTSYQKDYVNDRNRADPVELYLKPGEKTVTVYLREDGTRLDRIELELVE